MIDHEAGLIITKEWARRLGPASQTLAAMVRLSAGGRTGASWYLLAEAAQLSKRTMMNHFRTLKKESLIEVDNSGSFRSLLLQTTTPDAFYHDVHLFISDNHLGLVHKWADRCLLGYIAAVNSAAQCFSASKIVDRCAVSCRGISDETGLCLRSVCESKASLAKMGLIQVVKGSIAHDSDGRLMQQPDSLMLSVA